MAADTARTIDEYIAGFPSEVAELLSHIRETARSVAPDAVEKISYGMPTFWLRKNILYFGAFKRHIGIFPPVREPDLADRVAPYQGEKGNLRLPLDQPIPYELIADIVRARVLATNRHQKSLSPDQFGAGIGIKVRHNNRLE